MAEPSATEKETARSLMDEGDRLLAKGELTPALKRYRAAHQIMGVPTTGIEVAQVQEKLGLLVEARATAIEVAHSAPSPREPAVFAEARSAAAELASRLEARIASVTIEIGPPEADTTTKIGETVVPQVALGLPYKVNPGKHVLVVTAPGYTLQEMNFEVAEGEERVLRMLLARDNSVPPGPGVEEQPPAPEPLAEGSAGDGARLDTGDAASAGSIQTRTWVAFGVAAAAGLVGGGAGVYSLIQTNDAKSRCDGNVCPANVRDTIDGAKTMAWVANIGLGVAVLAAGYGVYTLLSADDGPAPTQGHVRQVKPHQSAASRMWETSNVGVALSPRGDAAAVVWTGAF